MSLDELIELARRQNILISSMASQFSELLEVNEALEGEHAKQIAELTAMNSDLSASIGCVVCRLRPLRRAPATGRPLERRAGLRPLLHRRAATPRPLRAVRADPPAGRPARPARHHLRRLRRNPGHPPMHRLRDRGQAL